MKTNLKLAALAIVFLFIGVTLGAQFFEELQDSSTSGLAQYDHQAETITELRRHLIQARVRIGLLEEQLQDPLTAPIDSEIQASIPVTAPLAISDSLTADEALIGSSTPTALSERLEELEADLEKAKNGELKLSDEELQERVSGLQEAFDQAMNAKDGPTALKAMMSLSQLDKRAFPALIDLWNKMRKNRWFGLNGGQRRLWFNAKVFHWALNSESLGADDKSAKAFRVQALRFLPWYEPDPAKQAESYAKFLESTKKPGVELSDKEKKLLKRGWRRNGDLFRGTIERLGTVNDPKSNKLLTGYAEDRNLPVDVRAMALNGLGRQGTSSRDADRVIEDALRDPNGNIRRVATIAQARRRPVASGWLVKGVNKKSPLFKSAKIGGVITKYNGRKIRNENELKRAIRRSKGQQIVVEVNNGGIISLVNIAGGRDLKINGERVQKR
jgi:hypothetical protein